MSDFDRLSDDQLLARYVETRRAAWEAPKSHGSSNAWADRSNEWVKVREEVVRRGLPEPEMHPSQKSD